MRKTVALAAAGSLVAIGGAAWAGGLDQKIELGDWKVDQHDIGEVLGPSIDFTLDANNNPVIGFAVSFDFTNQDNDSSWASDLEFKITDPGGGTYIVGQEAFNGGDPFGPQDDIWDFDGPDSQPSGFYSSDHFPGAWVDGIDKGGTWNVMLAESWDGGVAFDNISLTLIKIPTPGALALLGVVGLLGVPRRRRC